MFEEPYRWIEAVGNRRQYLDEQFKQGSPVVALSFQEGLLLLTVCRGTPKLYEIYDRIGLGGMGHPADLEKLRFSLLDMAHLEGFQRSPSDVTGSRLVKYGLAPVIKQAFEEIFKAPYITKILLAELGHLAQQDRYFTIEYDGGFEETLNYACLAATPDTQHHMIRYLKDSPLHPHSSLEEALAIGLKAWGLGSWFQEQEVSSLPPRHQGEEEHASVSKPDLPNEATITDYLRQTLPEKSLECATLNRSLPGSSKYLLLSPSMVDSLLPSSLQGVL